MHSVRQRGIIDITIEREKKKLQTSISINIRTWEGLLEESKRYAEGNYVINSGKLINITNERKQKKLQLQTSILNNI